MEEKQFMADKKYLDKEGLTHLWSKIKKYLGTWKTSNFGKGTLNSEGSFYNYGNVYIENGTLNIGAGSAFEVGGGFTLYSGICNVLQGGVYAIGYSIKTTHGMAYIWGNASTYAKYVVNNTLRKVILTSIPIPAGTSTQFDKAISEAVVVEIESGEQSSVTPVGSYQGALIFW